MHGDDGYVHALRSGWSGGARYAESPEASVHPSTLAASGGAGWHGPFSLATLQTWCLFS